jgi:hypothetical protein
MSVGALSAVGGVYVPVNDAAVTLNTGYLVYKECTLRGIVDRMRENETANIQRATLKALQSGRSGLPLFSQNLALEKTVLYTDSVKKDVDGTYLNTIDPAYQATVKRAIQQGYAATLGKPSQAFACPSSTDFWSRIDSLSFNPACNSYGAYYVANSAVMSAAAAQWNDQLTQLQWGNGIYPRTAIDPATGLPFVTTPSSFVGANALQVLQTGFAQLQNANDIDQIVGALFAGITNQVIADQGGLAGLTQKNGDQSSYLDRVVAESAAGLRNALGNGALTVLGGAKTAEQGLLAAWNGIAQKLLDTISVVRAQESTCWNLIIDSVCAAKPDSSGKCTAKPGACTNNGDGTQSCPTPPTLKVATSTVYSQAVINASIAPLATSTQTNIGASENLLATINQLIADVADTSSFQKQQAAIQKTDQLDTQHAFHSSNDVNNALKTKDDIDSQMDTLKDDTAKQWGDSTDVSVGWCNVGNPSLLNYWKNKWKQ